METMQKENKSAIIIEEVSQDKLETEGSNECSESMRKKIEVLLQSPKSESINDEVVPFESERLLAAWVLLTRLSKDDLNSIWEKFQSTLQPFARDIVSHGQENQHCRDLYIRLIAQITARLSSNYPAELGIELHKAWLQTPISSDTIALNMDLLSTLDVWMESKPGSIDSINIMEQIWNAHLQISVLPENISGKQSNDNSKNINEGSSTANKTGEEEREEKEEENTDWKMMRETLESLLDNLEEHEEYSKLGFQEMTLAIFQTHGIHMVPDGLAPSILKWIVSNESQGLPNALRATWHEWFLNLIQSRIASSESLRLLLLQDPQIVIHLNQLLLAHVVSPSDQSLRAMAWQTLIGIIENCGWNWMLRVSTSSSKFGRGTTICTWVRMASGEYRIQLQTPRDSAWLHAIAVPVGDACAHLLISVIQYCVGLEDEPHRMPLSSDALLHLRQSLEQSLWTTVEYLQSMEENPDFSVMAIRLFGALLMEISIWDLMNRGLGDQSTSQGLLDCLASVLQTAEDYSLLPGIVNVLGDAETDPQKIKDLECLWEPLLDYLEGFWLQDNIPLVRRLDDTVAWACSCTELWATLIHEIDEGNKKKRRMAMALIEWIQSILQANPTDMQQIAFPVLQSYLSLSIGCYMTLSKDREKPPGEHESRVVGRAFQLCGMSQ